MKSPGIPSRYILFPILGIFLFLLLIACPGMKQGAVHPPATIPGAKYVGMKICAACHEKTVKDFKYTRHSRLQVKLPDGREIPGCEACHGAGSLHVEAGGGKGVKIINPGKNPVTCYQCHPDIQGFFSLQYHHPMKEQGFTCINCHSPHGQNIMLASGTRIGLPHAPCSNCHLDKSKPFVFVHEALREGCATCHSPMGSINDKLLVANDANLCLRCHAQITDGVIEFGDQNHNARLAEGPCWSSGCHTAIHGSNINAHLRY
jgi:predicted CXXCH cytochrome family protein